MSRRRRFRSFKGKAQTRNISQPYTTEKSFVAEQQKKTFLWDLKRNGATRQAINSLDASFRRKKYSLVCFSLHEVSAINSENVFFGVARGLNSKVSLRSVLKDFLHLSNRLHSSSFAFVARFIPTIVWLPDFFSCTFSLFSSLFVSSSMTSE